MTIRHALVAAILLAIITAFAWTGGWFSPTAATPNRIIDAFEAANGVHPGFRRNHAKGIGFRGTFHGNLDGVHLSHASLFGHDTPVLGRFALAGGMPYIADTPGNARSMALRFRLPSNEEWRMAMNNTPVFPVRNGEEMRDLLVATAPDPATHKPDPAKVGAFMTAHPATQQAMALTKAAPPTAGFADSTFNSLDAFYFVDGDGHKTPVRWAMVPEATEPATTGQGSNALFDAVIAAVHAKPLRWHMIVTIADPSDAIDDPTIPWPSTRKQVDVGTLSIDTIELEEVSDARIVNFDPTILPSGVEVSNDPILSARSAAYSVSLRRRLAEPVSPSAVR
ncbi:MAG: catalase family peroxidase [Kofleriaceae bacterium]